MGKFEYENARLAFEQALALDERNAEVLVNLAIATLNRQREGDEDRALAILDQVLQVDPGNVRAIYNQGLLRLYLQSPEEAQPLFEKVVHADANDAFAAYYLGQCFAQQRQYDSALEQYRRAMEIDPNIRSAYYAASQARRALGHDDDAAKMLAQFQELERRPQAHLAEFKYTRMGPKAMAQAIDAPDAQRVAMKNPEGPLFLDPQPLLSNSDQFKWKPVDASPERPVSITAADIDHDNDIDIFIANCLDEAGLHNAVCVNDGKGVFTLDRDHVLASIPNVNAALWGDGDNDGFTDVYLCRTGPNMLWRFSPSVPGRGEWRDISAAAGVDNGEFDSVDGALFDADHDGDLDIFVVNANGPNELFNNNVDGTFKPIAAQAGIAGEGKGSRQVLPVDLDGDRDDDIIVINRDTPYDVWTNERAWSYVRASGFDEFRKADIDSVLATDADADGAIELRTQQQNGAVSDTWVRNDQGAWVWAVGPRTLLGVLPWSDRLALCDASGAGRGATIVAAGQRGLRIVELARGQTAGIAGDVGHLNGFAVCMFDGTGPSLVASAVSGPPLIWRPGPGRFPFATISFTGRQVTSDNKQVRSNASGIGTRFAARVDSRWIAGHTLRDSSGPGQSLQPVAIGLGGAEKIDYISIDWSDGVFQTEIDLEAGKHHVIEETQRQLSSCPVLFAWDGECYRFITDLLGVGGMGYLVAPNEHARPRPWENLLLPADAIQPRDGQMILKLGEPMEEACYLDAARLVAYDLPPGWDMTVDDRMRIGGGPEPTGEGMFYRRESLRAPDRAVNDRGEDVTASLRKVDLVAAPVGEIDDRFIGRLMHEHVVTLSFDERMLRRERRGGGVLLIDGWVEYPYSQTMFAASQAKATYQAPTLEMRDANGEWKAVYEQFGYPAGMPRQMALPLPDDVDISSGTELRIRTNQEIYFDRIALAAIEDCAEARRIELPLAVATMADVGFPKRTTGPQRQPHYDYFQRAPLWDTRHQRGFYTEFGRCDELVTREDNALAIFGPGEEIELRYDAGVLPPLADGWSLRFVLEARGWCKDMDLYTEDGETLEPLPMGESPHASDREALHQRFNTRYESGR
jgi:Flp pilus assembly protein TadD